MSSADPREEASDSPDDQDGGESRFDIALGATAGIAVLFLLLRMLAVAHWNWDTTSSLADSFDVDDAFSVGFGTVSNQPILTGAAVALLLPLVLMRLLWPTDDQRRHIRVSLILSAVTLVAIAYAMTMTYRTPWTLVATTAVGLVLTVIRLFARHGARRFVAAMTGQIAVIAAAAALLLAAVDDEPWMDEEHITTTDRGVIDGYVLDAEPGFLHVLTVDRRVIIVPTKNVLERDLVE
ncbi:MAG: hypothetical protein QM658_14625 [Gordonia sp. (in: high G+C Gram-positive bacteria)]